uniref:2-alkenal reductase (NAD(P)(+)) n=1 Tax=Opuntia streptacantha TaxID=393608 RepID=A0A7C8YLL8_OPUST
MKITIHQAKTQIKTLPPPPTMSSQHILLLLFLLLLSLHPSLSSAKRCHPDDERALLQIKAHFNNAEFFKTWTPQTACCRKWTLVYCKRLPNSKIFRVNFLEISGEEGINGEIPSAVGDLPYLEILIFRLLPNLTGPIPSAIGKLTRLQSLFLFSNNLTGSIPPFLSRLSNVSYIDLSNNRLTGQIPSFLGHISTLQGIDLSQNQLTGPIPPSFGLLGDDFQLFASDNKLSGPIPRSLGQVRFNTLVLGGNQLTGDASFLFGKDKQSLTRLILSGNRLSFNLTNTVMSGSEREAELLELDLSHNMIYGQLPTWLGHLPFIYDFNVSYNQLCGPIPTEGGTLQKYDASAFSHNKCLCGAPLPPCKSTLN